jgi:hypothetical protein
MRKKRVEKTFFKEPDDVKYLDFSGRFEHLDAFTPHQ